MAKDPAFLFYSSDFLTGTLTMSNEEVGMYIRLLCLQHQKGVLYEKDMINICKSYVKDVYEKFSLKDGCYINERLALEASKRSTYAESRRKNRLGKNKKHILDISKTYDEHMENENEDINIIYKKECENQKIWVDSVLMKTKLTETELIKKLNDFVIHLTTIGEKKKDLKDFKYHFSNWVRFPSAPQKQNGKSAPDVHGFLNG